MKKLSSKKKYLLILIITFFFTGCSSDSPKNTSSNKSSINASTPLSTPIVSPTVKPSVNPITGLTNEEEKNLEKSNTMLKTNSATGNKSLTKENKQKVKEE